jgi:uncharacterized protein
MSIFRVLKNEVQKYLNMYPVIAITGPRQSGKTTMLRRLFPDYTYLNLENTEVMSFAKDDIKGFFQTYSDKIIIDEVQKLPELFSYIQYLVDETGKMGQIIISGSQNFQLIERICQSLAGRVALFRLFPFDIEEMKQAELLPEFYTEHLIRGCYPAMYDRGIPSRVFYSNYLSTYVERDIVSLVNIRELNNFRKFVGLCAARCAQILNLSSLATECGITQPTAKSWLSLLESSYITFTLMPFTQNHSKRLIKSPKLYFYDTGLVCSLLRITDPHKLLTKPVKAHLFENLVVSEYHKLNAHRGTPYEFYYWRDSQGNEVDLIRLGDDGQKDLIEIKSTNTITPELLRGIKYYEKIPSVSEISSRTVVYAGDTRLERFGAKFISWRDLCDIPSFSSNQ